MVVSVSRNIQSYDPYKMEARLVQEKIEEYHLAKIRQQEKVHNKIILDKLLLEAYFEKLDRLATYNAKAQLERAQADMGKIIDIEV